MFAYVLASPPSAPASFARRLSFFFSEKSLISTWPFFRSLAFSLFLLSRLARSRLIRTAAPIAARRFSAAPAVSGSPSASGFDLEMNKVCNEATMASLAKQYGAKSKGQVSTWVGAKMSKTDKLYAYFTDNSGKFTYERVRISNFGSHFVQVFFLI